MREYKLGDTVRVRKTKQWKVMNGPFRYDEAGRPLDDNGELMSAFDYDVVILDTEEKVKQFNEAVPK